MPDKAIGTFLCTFSDIMRRVMGKHDIKNWYIIGINIDEKNKTKIILIVINSTNSVW